MPNVQTLPNIMGMNKMKGNITQSKNGSRQTYTADSGVRDRGIARNLSQYAGSNPGPQYYVDIGGANGPPQGSSMKSAGGLGVGQQYNVAQPSHLGVYRHDTSISLMKSNMQ